MQPANASLMGHIVSILALMSCDIAVACYAIQQQPTLLTTQMVYFMAWQIGFAIGMSWYLTTFSVTPNGISISTVSGAVGSPTVNPIVGVSTDGKNTTVVIPSGYIVSSG